MSKATSDFNKMKAYLEENQGYGGLDSETATHDRLAALLAIAEALNRIASELAKKTQD